MDDELHVRTATSIDKIRARLVTARTRGCDDWMRFDTIARASIQDRRSVGSCVARVGIRDVIATTRRRVLYVASIKSIGYPSNQSIRVRACASLTDLLGTNGRNRLTRAQRSRTRVTHADYIGYDSHGELAAIIVHGWIAARVWCGSEGWMDTW